MGLLDYGAPTDDLAVAPGAKDAKIYKTVQFVAILVFIVAAVLLVLEVFGLLALGYALNGIILSVGVIALGGMTALPWVRVFESIKDKRFTVTAIVFLSVIGLCVILWIVCVWQIIGLVKSAMSDEATKGFAGTLNFIRVSLIISMQFVIASSIAMNVIKYRKELKTYQIISGIGKLYADFYLILVFTALNISNKGLELSGSAELLINRWTLALLVIAVILIAFPSVVFRRIDRKRLLEAKQADSKEKVSAESRENANSAAGASSGGEDAEAKLKKLRSLLDSGLITQEEFDTKRAEIINNL